MGDDDPLHRARAEYARRHRAVCGRGQHLVPAHLQIQLLRMGTDGSDEFTRENSLCPYAEQKVHVVAAISLPLSVTHFGRSGPLGLFIALRRTNGRNRGVRRWRTARRDICVPLKLRAGRDSIYPPRRPLAPAFRAVQSTFRRKRGDSGPISKILIIKINYIFGPDLLFLLQNMYEFD